MSRSKSSQRWLKEHFSDPYVKKAQSQGYRSRAAFKLLEIQEKDKILKPGMTVVDLGAAPGGWSQLAAQIVGAKGHVFALDILSMDDLPGVTFLKGDFQKPEVAEELLKQMAENQADLVISDMAPNMSGMAVVDQSRAMYLTELALEFAKKVLKNEGCFLVKAFQGADFEVFLKNLRKKFRQVLIRKPKSSRQRSREVYLLAKGYRAGGDKKL